MKPTPLLLLVPLVYATLGFAEPATQQPTSATGWQRSQETDAGRTFNFTRYTLVGKFLTSPRTQVANRPALSLDCIPVTESQAANGKLLASNLLVGTPLKIIYVEPEEIHGTSYFPKVVVRYRAGDAKQEEEQWSSGTEKTSASVPKHALKRILLAHTVVITADDDHGSPLTMQFDMPDSTLVEAGCNVDDHK